MIFGEKHLNYLIREYVRYYNDNRAHSSQDFLPPSCADPPPVNETIVLEQITRHERFGGLIALLKTPLELLAAAR
ncbi:hypothetical protein [Symmachiella dynata]|uniref:hypothetical protein n=1 Tax=Symmachiella dynata TaxID=2527995 RepID=UPI00119D3963|nr:hypothetical protein [Symmachiella dynata]